MKILEFFKLFFFRMRYAFSGNCTEETIELYLMREYDVRFCRRSSIRMTLVGTISYPMRMRNWMPKTDLKKNGGNFWYLNPNLKTLRGKCYHVNDSECKELMQWMRNALEKNEGGMSEEQKTSFREMLDEKNGDGNYLVNSHISKSPRERDGILVARIL